MWYNLVKISERIAPEFDHQLYMDAQRKRTGANGNIHNVGSMLMRYRNCQKALANGQSLSDQEWQEQLVLYERAKKALQEFCVHGNSQKAMKDNGWKDQYIAEPNEGIQATPEWYAQQKQHLNEYEQKYLKRPLNGD